MHRRRISGCAATLGGVCNSGAKFKFKVSDVFCLAWIARSEPRGLCNPVRVK
jgi:hypothetical protein